jgi:hypothetical protein
MHQATPEPVLRLARAQLVHRRRGPSRCWPGSPLLAVTALAGVIGTLLGGAASVVPVALLGAQPLAPALAAE